MITKDIRRTRVAWGCWRRASLVLLVDDWCARVIKLADDAAGDVEAPTAWAVHDVMGAYILRDAIEDALQAKRTRGDDMPLPTVAAADALLRSFSRPDDRRVIASLDPEQAGTGWWWGLIPRTGPVAAEAGYLPG